MEDFLADSSPTAFAKVVDRLLASPQYGERWARHWLDLVRYAETNGHEFDNDKIDAWRYRDYVIRAFNEDVPYNQFVREHIAGDLLPVKRLSRDRTYWESPLGTSFYWFGEILNSATDSVKSRADEVDNQIDVMSKAFFGLTVACARCHDHKFDPIPTADYYALAGVLHSTALTETVIDSPERERQIAAKIPAMIRVEAPIPPPTDDAAFEDFSKPAYKGWRVTGQAFGLRTRARRGQLLRGLGRFDGLPDISNVPHAQALRACENGRVKVRDPFEGAVAAAPHIGGRRT